MHHNKPNKTSHGYKLPLLEAGSALLAELTGWRLSWSPEPPGGDGRLDCVLHLDPAISPEIETKAAAPPQPQRRVDVGIVCMRKATMASLALRMPVLMDLQATCDAPVMLLAPSIPKNCGAALRASRFCYLDLKGNLFLKIDDVWLWFTGAAKATDSNAVRWPAEKLGSMTETVTRLAYLLLTDPGSVKWPFRKLAERSGISVGSVKSAMDWLERHEHVRNFGRAGKRALVGRRDLLAKWVQSYADRLRPKLLIGRYRVVMEESAQYGPSVALFAPPTAPESFVKGGPLAATALLKTGYAGGGQMAYVRDRRTVNRIIAANRLRSDAKGDVELLSTFWPVEDEIMPGFAPPLVIYADLLNATSSRQWEFAEQIYDRHLKECIGDV